MSLDPHSPAPLPVSEEPEAGLWQRMEERVFRFLLPRSELDLEGGLFRGLTLLGAFMAFFVVLPLNYFQRLFPLVNVLVAVLGLAALGVHLLARRGLPLPGTFFLLLLALLDVIWFGNAGSEGSIGMFFMCASVYLVLFFRGWRRALMLGLFLANGTALYVVERAWPQLVTRFPDPDSRFIDLLGSFLLCNLVLMLLQWVVLGGYHRVHRRERESAQALAASERRFRRLLAEAPVPMALLRSDGSLDLNEAFVKTFGYGPDQLPDIEAWWALAYPDPEVREQSQASWRAAVAQAQASGRPIPPREFPIRCADGRTRPMEIQGALIEGQWLVMFTDLTERRAAEAILRDRELQLLKAQEAGQVGTFSWEIPADRWTSTPVLDRILGLPVDFIYDLAHWNALVRPDYREHMAEYVASLLREQRAFNFDYPIVRPLDGAERWVRGRAEFEFDEQGSPIRMWGTIQDITEARGAEAARRSLELEVHRAQKMESLGGLAGGVAHDMNNVLGAILGMASAQQTREPEGAPGWRSMDTIIRACLRGRDLVQGLLDFTRSELGEPCLLDLNALVREQVKLLEHTTLGTVEVRMDLEEPLLAVKGEASALSHALMNLAINALDAMPQGGRLTFRTRNLGTAAVELVAVDNGQGMTPDVLAKALDPYFTTKPHGRGAGLGLSLVYATVKAHAGELDLASEPGAGTTVQMRFPAAERPASERAPSDETAGQACLRKILVVDDDPLIRESLRALLEVLGHAVVEASCGEEALEILTQGEALDGVILDLNMPGLGGAGTLPRLRKLRPGLPVLVATGRPDQAALAMVAPYEGVALLPKPFSGKELQATLAAWG